MLSPMAMAKEAAYESRDTAADASEAHHERPSSSFPQELPVFPWPDPVKHAAEAREWREEQGDAAPQGQLQPPEAGNCPQQPAWQHPPLANGLEDRRVERKRNGVVKFQVEREVPDVGSICWRRSKAGHMLKNQAFYSAAPRQNLWDNVTHAGPRTWRSFHGPKLRTDADLMERLDRLDDEQAAWDVRKAFVNTARVQTLDRLNNQKVENTERAIAGEWAPHRRARREVHDSFEAISAELDSMPLKELKKMMTGIALRGDREGVRMLSSRLQLESTWKKAWKEVEAERRQQNLRDTQQRQTFNEILAELSGQPGRMRSEPARQSARVSPRVQELAKPKVEYEMKDITQLSDFRGLMHVDHHHAMERLLPGQGHELVSQFRGQVTASVQPGWPPPPRAQTPELQDLPRSSPRRQQKIAENLRVTRRSLAVTTKRLQQAVSRKDETVLAKKASPQRTTREAPPAPDQDKGLAEEELMARVISWQQQGGGSDVPGDGGLPGSAGHGHPRRTSASWSRVSPGYSAPTKPSYIYPVIVPMAPEGGRAPHQSARGHSSGGVGTAVASGSSSARSARHKDGDLVEPSLEALNQSITHFEASLQPVPDIGNFWMAPSARSTKAHDLDSFTPQARHCDTEFEADGNAAELV